MLILLISYAPPVMYMFSRYRFISSYTFGFVKRNRFIEVEFEFDARLKALSKLS